MTQASRMKAHEEKDYEQKEHAMRHLEPPQHLTVPLAMLCLAASLLLAGAPAEAQTTEEKLAAGSAAPEAAPQIATLQVLRKAEVPGPSATNSPWQGPSALSQAPNPKLVEATCTGLDVTAGAPGALVFDDEFETGNLDAWSAPGDRFSPRSVLDLEFSAQLRGLSGEALLRVELISPAGHAYQTLEAPVVVAPSAASAPQSRLVDGYPYPVPVRFVLPTGEAGGLTVSIAWPLAGTHVVSHGLYGEWTVSASLIDPSSPNGSVVACPASKFTLRP